MHFERFEAWFLDNVMLERGGSDGARGNMWVPFFYKQAAVPWPFGLQIGEQVHDGY